MNVNEILSRLKISELNAMQKQTMEASLKHKDIVLLSPTGSGKTLAFILSFLDSLKADVKGVQVIVLAPSRELGLQIEQVFKSVTNQFKVSCFYGGHPFKTERNSLIEPPAVLIGTPGRVADHIKRETFSTRHVKVLVLDEFDKSLEFGFKNEMSFIIENLAFIQQRVLTSATDIDEIPEFTGVKEPFTINYLKNAAPLDIVLKKVVSKTQDKLDALFALLCVIGDAPSIVFCNHRDAVQRISDLLQQRGMAHGVFHGGLEQDEREKTLLQFRNGSKNILVTTDLASRGLDIPGVGFVIHYQLPATESVYIHRIGRTARMNASGIVYFVLSEEEYIPAFIKDKIKEEQLPVKYSLPEKPHWITLYFSAGKKDKLNKVDIVGFLLQRGGLSKEELGRIEVLDNSSYAAVVRSKAQALVAKLKDEKIKNKKIKIGISY